MLLTNADHVTQRAKYSGGSSVMSVEDDLAQIRTL